MVATAGTITADADDTVCALMATARPAAVAAAAAAAALLV
jgi:hypothetical protein